MLTFYFRRTIETGCTPPDSLVNERTVHVKKDGTEYACAWDLDADSPVVDAMESDPLVIMLDQSSFEALINSPGW